VKQFTHALTVSTRGKGLYEITREIADLAAPNARWDAITQGNTSGI